MYSRSTTVFQNVPNSGTIAHDKQPTVGQ